MDGFSFCIGAFLGAFAAIFLLGSVVSLKQDAAREECQAKLNVTECVRKVEWVAKP